VTHDGEQFRHLRDASPQTAAALGSHNALSKRVRRRIGVVTGGVTLLALAGAGLVYGLASPSTGHSAANARLAAQRPPTTLAAAVARGSSSAPTIDRRPACNLPPPVVGFSSDSDAGIITRTVGTSATALPAHLLTISGISLADIRVVVLRPNANLYAPPTSQQQSGPPRSTSTATWHVESLGSAPAEGTTITARIGDVADDGSVIPAGTYEVYFSAKETGTNECGQSLTELVTTRLGYLTVQAV